MARMSLEHSFLPGHSLWGDPATFRVADACGKPQDKLGAALDSLSPGCRNFLNQNERARTQWGLEEKFEQFETKVSELSGKALL
jgi:hypothetical protein